MDKNSEDRQASVRGFTEERWTEPTHRHRDKSAKQAFDELLPASADASYEMTENGIFVFTPAVGPTAAVDGLWSALAIRWTQAGGYGRVLAEWRENGVPRLPSGPVDTGSIHVRRFEPHAGETDYFVDRGATRYEQVYMVVGPRWQPDEHAEAGTPVTVQCEGQRYDATIRAGTRSSGSA